MPDVIPPSVPYPSPVSFATDVRPILAPYRTQMLWRFDLTDYDQMKANAELIWQAIGPSDSQFMPPRMFNPLNESQIQTFRAWMRDGCQP